MWWLQPGWKAARCADCGANIWDSGGDPDHGVCHDCWHVRYEDGRREQEHYREEAIRLRAQMELEQWEADQREVNHEPA